MTPERMEDNDKAHKARGCCDGWLPVVTTPVSVLPSAIGRLGWVAFGAMPQDVLACARYEAPPPGRLVVAELHVVGGRDPLTGPLLRALPIGRFEAYAQEASSRARILSKLRPDASRREVVDALTELIDAIGTTSGFDDELADLFRPLDRQRVREGDDFYREVALQYGLRALGSRRPAADLAEEAGVPVATAHRWVSEARRRGFMPPGRKGQVG